MPLASKPLLLCVHLATPARFDGAFHSAVFDAIFFARSAAQRPAAFDASSALNPAWALKAQAGDIASQRLDQLAKIAAQAGTSLACLSLGPPLDAWSPSAPSPDWGTQALARERLLDWAREAGAALAPAVELLDPQPLFAREQFSTTEAPAKPLDPMANLQGGYPWMLRPSFFSGLFQEGLAQWEARTLRHEAPASPARAPRAL